jgi:hypothetical protein
VTASRTSRRRRSPALLLAALLAVSTSGCLGVAVESPARPAQRRTYTTLRWHLITAPRIIDASECTRGIADIATYVPLWGLAVGIVTFGIVVPQRTTYSCAAG